MGQVSCTEVIEVQRCVKEIKTRTALNKKVFVEKRTLFSDLKLKKQLVKCSV